MIRGSAGHEAAIRGDAPIDLSRVPLVEPDDLAEAMWTMPAKRDRAEEVIPS